MGWGCRLATTPFLILSSPFLPFTHHFSSGRPGWGKASPAQHNFPRPRSLGRSEPQPAAAAACHSPCCTPATFTNGASLTHPSWQLQEVGNAEPCATQGVPEAQRREVTCLRRVTLELDPIPAPCHLWISILSQTQLYGLLISSGARGAQEELTAWGVRSQSIPGKGGASASCEGSGGQLGPLWLLGSTWAKRVLFEEGVQADSLLRYRPALQELQAARGEAQT